MFIKEILLENKNGVSDTPVGFNSKYKNFVDYILDITEEIWEKRAIWLLYDTYAEDVIIHSGAKTIQGRDLVFEGTIKTLYAFPDRTMYGEAVIWSRYKDIFDGTTTVTESKNEQFFSSHRIWSTATNDGPSLYGAATGKKIHFRTIADCLAVDNFIFEEWLVRDNLYVLQQLGFDAIKCAKHEKRYENINIEAYTDYAHGITEEQEKILIAKSEDAESVVLSMVQEVWREKKYESAKEYYAPGSCIHGICDIDARTNNEYESLWNDIFIPFSDGKIQIDQITSTQHEDKTEVAIRWRLKGIHTNAGMFGEASQQTVNILGINHFVLREQKIVEEWFLFDAYDVMCQIYS